MLRSKHRESIVPRPNSSIIIIPYKERDGGTAHVVVAEVNKPDTAKEDMETNIATIPASYQKGMNLQEFMKTQNRPVITLTKESNSIEVIMAVIKALSQNPEASASGNVQTAAGVLHSDERASATAAEAIISVASIVVPKNWQMVSKFMAGAITNASGHEHWNDAMLTYSVEHGRHDDHGRMRLIGVASENDGYNPISDID